MSSHAGSVTTTLMQVSETTLIDPSLSDRGELFGEYNLQMLFQSLDGTTPQYQNATIKTIVTKDGANLTGVTFELTCEADPFFYFESRFERSTFDEYALNQGIKIQFEDFPGAVDEILTSGPSSNYQTSFTSSNENSCVMTISQQLRFKTVTLLTITFIPCSEEFVRQQIQYKFDILRSRLASVTAERDNLCAMLKIKNPATLSTLSATGKTSKK